MRSYHVGVAAEAFASGVLAQAGCDVLVQYGANQPEYDLVITKHDKSVKVSVKGSQDGAWGLVGRHKRGRSYHEAIDHWLKAQDPKIVYCFVQFEDVPLGKCPRIYLATASEVAAHLKRCRAGFGTTVLHERHNYTRGDAAGTTDALPARWNLGNDRIEELLHKA